MSDEPEKSKTKKAVREAGHSENVAALSSLLSTPKIEEMAPEERQRHIEAAKLSHVIRVRRKYKWPWGAGAEYLYRELIRAKQLEHHEEDLIAFAKARPGRKQNYFVFRRIMSLRQRGNTVRQIQAVLASEGKTSAKKPSKLSSIPTIPRSAEWPFSPWAPWTICADWAMP